MVFRGLGVRTSYIWKAAYPIVAISISSMDIKAIQKALSKIPQLKAIEGEESDVKVDDLLSAAEEFTKIVRKLGIRIVASLAVTNMKPHSAGLIGLIV